MSDFNFSDLKQISCYHIMYKDDCVADVYTNNNNIVQKIIKYIPDSPKQPFWGETENMSKQYLTEKFYNFLKERCYEDGRADLDEILELAGMKENNPYKWVKVSHGVTYEDFFWLKFDDEIIKWEDVRVR